MTWQNLRPESALCLGLREGRDAVGHFGNATGRGAFTDAVSRYRMESPRITNINLFT